MKTFLIFVNVLAITPMVMAQEVAEHPRKNVIKLEVSHAIYPNSLVISYERVTKPNESFCITAGYEEFPPIVNVNSTIHVKQDLNRHGYKFGTEYRFYLKSENRHPAPHGTYIGPYLAFHNFSNKRAIEVDYSGVAEQAELETDLNILNIGIQMGHQFVFGNRWTVDVVAIGPAIAKYHASLKLNGDFTFDKDEVQSEILLKILDRFPMLDELLTNKEISSQGNYDAWSYGWRAQLHVGYHFGRKKK